MPFIHTLRLVTPTVLTLLGSTFFTPFTSMTAAELVSEPFAYSASIGGLANKNGGVGWTAAWDAGANNTVATGLTYISGADTLLVSGGSADIISDPTTISSFRALPAAQSTGSVWISFLTSVERFGNGYAGLSLFNGGTEQLFIGQRDSQTVWGIEGNSVNSNSTSSTQSTTFLLVRLDMKAGNDDVFLWTNPALAAQPSDASATQLLAFGNLDFNRLRFECGNNSGAFHVDELRCGTTFSSVAPRVGANNPPTVASAATATPSPVTEITTSVAVLGADDGGEPGLIYTWSATGPASVSFSPNATNASQNATATFHAAGAYVLTATISDGTLTQTSTVPVTVSAVLTGISVSPATTTVTPGDPVIFSATTVDQFGNAMANQPTMTWSMPAQAGTISALGVATTSTTAGGPFTVSASASSISGTAQLTLQAGSVPPTGGGESSFALEGKQGESGGCGLGGLAAITGMMVFFTRARYRH